MKETKQKIVSYIRSATTEKQSVKAAQMELKVLLDRHKNNWEIVGQFEDFGVSGCTYSRDGFDGLIESIKENGATAIVVPNCSMIGRRGETIMRLIVKLKTSGIKDVYIGDNKLNLNNFID